MERCSLVLKHQGLVRRFAPLPKSFAIVLRMKNTMQKIIEKR